MQNHTSIASQKASKKKSVKNVFHLGANQPKSLVEANEIVAVIIRLTKDYAFKVNNLIAQIDNNRNLTVEQIKELEEEVSLLIDQWNAKIKKLGAEPKGIWLADIDAGNGYYCWKYPEPEVLYWHEYDSGFTGRIAIHENTRT